MAVPYKRILSGVGLRIRALNITTAASASAAYTGQTWKSARFPKEAVQDAILNAVAHYAEIIAETGNHPWRTYFTATLTSLADAAEIPAIATDDELPIIGIYGEIRDHTDQRALTEKNVSYIERCIRLEYDDYHYKLLGNKIRHTRELVDMDVCVYDAATERTALASGNMILPDPLEPAVMAHALSQLVITEEYQSQASFYGQFAAMVADQIKKGMTSVTSILAPSPVSGPNQQ